MNRLSLFFVLLPLMVSCKTQQLYLNVLEPAPVTLLSGVASAGIIDRSAVAKGARVLDAIDKVITLEGAELDNTGAGACIEGLTGKLIENDRFSKIVRIEEKFQGSPFPGTFPPPLEWQVAERICRENSVGLIFSLESFDTDTRINYQVSKGTTPKTLLGAVTGVEHQANMQTIVKTAWRIYYPDGRAIIDEYPLVHTLNFSAIGLTQIVAAAALLDRREAVRRTGLKAGEIYASRIIPYEITVERDYYVKGTNNFRIAMRKARTGKWDEAGELWKLETENPKSKIAARACFNMAIIAEIKGNLDVAREWAEKAYEDYNLRRAVKYIRIIENRMHKDQIIRTQEQQ